MSVEKTLLNQALKKANKPLWKGPEEDGITFSLLSRFLCCRHRFWVRTVLGLRPIEAFQARIAYGNMWHVCEEALAAEKPWQPLLIAYCNGLLKEHPGDQSDIDHWYRVCKAQFPVYVSYWAKQKDVKGRTPLAQETVFDQPVKLPSGRLVRLRGKFDSVDIIAKKLWLQENKTRGDVNEEKTEQQLHCDLQSMMYLFVMGQHWPGKLIGGVRYNVVRRPLSGGRHSIRRHKATKKKPEETKDAYFQRLANCIAGEPDYFFMRHTVNVSSDDVSTFLLEVLNPLLESLWDWWEWVSEAPLKPFRPGNRWHWKFPYGVFNSTLEGYASEVDNYINTGSMSGLKRVDTLFRELE